MIKVQTLRLRGLCASSLLALAACSGTPSNSNPGTNPDAGGGGPAPQPSRQDPAPNPTGSQDPNRAPNAAALVSQAVGNARRSMELKLFDDARNEAAFALTLDGSNEEARDILRRCHEILGDKVATIGSQFQDMVIRDQIRAERERSLVRQAMELAAAHTAKGEHGRAIERLEGAQIALRNSIYVQPGDALLKDVENRLSQAHAAKIQSDKDREAAAKAASSAELDRIARAQEVARELRVERLIEDANVQFQRGQYAASVDRLDQALLLDPTHKVGVALRDLADRARHNAAVELHRERFKQDWNKTLEELQRSNVPQTEVVKFDPGRWAEVSKRKPDTYSAPIDAASVDNQRILQKLNETILEHNFPSAQVADWAKYYGDVTGVTFFVMEDVRGLDAAVTTLTDFRLPRRSVADALKVIQAQTGVAYRVQDGMVQLVTPAKAIGTLYLAKYTVSDLIIGTANRPGPDLKLKTPDDDSPLIPVEEGEPPPALVNESRLMELLKATIKPGKWDGTDESPFSMESPEKSAVLFVRADEDTHKEVAHLLNELRRHVGIQVDVESRFLKVEDNFLEDVGVDLRGLGDQAAQGLAGRGLEKQGDRQNAGFDDFGPKQQQNAATPGLIGTGTEPGFFYNDGGDGDIMGRVENLYDQTLGGRSGGLTNAGGLSLQYAFLDDTEVEVVLRAVAKQERSEQIEAPRLLIYNNSRAHMSYLRNIAYIKDFEVEIAQAAAVANPVIGTVHDGVALDVRPVVDSELKFITMELRPSVMSLQLPIPTFTTTLGVGQPISIQLPSVTLQKVRTTVTMPDGATMVLGGMRIAERQDLSSGVPILKDLPGLSFLFSRRGNSVVNRKVLILIRAKIILMDEQEPKAIALPDGSVLTASK
ncbi:MAG: hypothetical protein IPK26_11940 [Planctomycetes bacterium]|nr:hypothetical protein [Planctomycetota bacterium]